MGSGETLGPARSTRSHWRRHWLHEEFHVPVVHAELVSSPERALGGAAGKAVLEVGAGMGGDSIRLAERGCDAYVLDYDEGALRLIRQFASQRRTTVRSVLGNALALPFGDGVFDAIFHQGLLEHFREGEQLRLLRENWRVLKAGGVLVVDVPQKYSQYTVYKHNRIRKGVWFAGWETEFSPRELRRIVRTAGFRVLSLYPREYYGLVNQLRRVFMHEPPAGVGHIVPRPLRALYRRLWRWVEQSPIQLYLCWSIGAVAEKPGAGAARPPAPPVVPA